MRARRGAKRQKSAERLPVRAKPMRNVGGSRVPVWDHVRGELWFGGALVFRRGRKCAPPLEHLLGLPRDSNWATATEVHLPEQLRDRLSPIQQVRQAN